MPEERPHARPTPAGNYCSRCGLDSKYWLDVAACPALTKGHEVPPDPATTYMLRVTFGNEHETVLTDDGEPVEYNTAAQAARAADDLMQMVGIAYDTLCESFGATEMVVTSVRSITCETSGGAT